MEGPKNKIRLDTLLVDKGLVDNRNRARAEIMAGNVFVDGVKKDKPGYFFTTTSDIQLKKPINPYVSRGGLKLQKAIDEFNLALDGKVVLDVGASTGGFTDCSLKHGASLVYALDVGFGQLAWKLRFHPRVVNLERFNVRNLTPEHLDSHPDFALIDASFISLKLILPVIARFPVNQVICLIKPQFEAKKEQVGKKGVVKKQEVHRDVINRIIEFAGQLNYRLRGLTYSPVRGPKGNIEYLMYLHYSKEKEMITENDRKGRVDFIATVVQKSHRYFHNEG